LVSVGTVVHAVKDASNEQQVSKLKECKILVLIFPFKDSAYLNILDTRQCSASRQRPVVFLCIGLVLGEET
jgi:hypothetical protein